MSVLGFGECSTRLSRTLLGGSEIVWEDDSPQDGKKVAIFLAWQEPRYFSTQETSQALGKVGWLVSASPDVPCQLSERPT